MALSTDNIPTEVAKPFAVRRHVNRKILGFSLRIGLVGAAIATVAYCLPVAAKLQEAQMVNQRALSQVNCTASACDTSSYTTTSWLEGPDYFIDEQARYFVDVPTSQQEELMRLPQLDLADTAFIREFRQPKSYTTPDGEVWRLYSHAAGPSDRNVEIILGYAQKAPWKILTASALEIRNIDRELQREADGMAENLSNMLRGAGSSQKLAADGFAVVDAKTGEILRWGPWIPMFLAKDAHVPTPGRHLYFGDRQLYVVQANDNGRFMALSLVFLGDFWWIGILATLVFIITGAIARSLSRRFLRNYFAVTNIRVPSLEEAFRSGEGQAVEFKRGLSEDETKVSNSDDELLRTIAAFANTNNGVIFVGVDDSGKAKGLGFDFSQKDRFERKIRQLARNRIKPSPPLEVSFTDVRGLVVARIVVARGEAPAYLLNGVIYVRSGSSDVQAQPEDLTKLFSAFAY
jgi:hypothetical protein